MMTSGDHDHDDDDDDADDDGLGGGVPGGGAVDPVKAS
jgi:hypothetical protein